MRLKLLSARRAEQSKAGTKEAREVAQSSILSDRVSGKTLEERLSLDMPDRG